MELPCSRLSNKTEWLVSKGRHGRTKMDTFRFGRKHWGDVGYKSKSYGTHQHCPHSGWTWKGHVGSNKSSTNPKIQFPSKFCPIFFCLKKCKDQNDRSGNIYWSKLSLGPFSLKIEWNQGIRNKSVFITVSINSLFIFFIKSLQVWLTFEVIDQLTLSCSRCSFEFCVQNRVKILDLMQNP